MGIGVLEECDGQQKEEKTIANGVWEDAIRWYVQTCQQSRPQAWTGDRFCRLRPPEYRPKAIVANRSENTSNFLNANQLDPEES